jgi:ZIP family zinc transporter
MVMNWLQLALGAGVAFAATALGAMLVLIFRKLNHATYSAMLSFSAGVMAFSAVEMLGQSHAAAGDIGVVAGVLLGMFALFAADMILPHAHARLRGSELAESKKKAALLTGAVTLHNVPEGLAIASAFAGSPGLGWLITASIALQDIPEGFMISAPLRSYGMGLWRSVSFGMFSGFVEFVAAIVAFAFIGSFAQAIPVALAFSAGAMIYIIFAELLPDAFRNGLQGVVALSFAAGAAVAFGIATLFAF